MRPGAIPAAVELVAVSKLHPAEAVAAACRAGVGQVGENYAQEMVAKIDALAGDAACASLAWHFIGRLQRNKARLVVGRAALIHAVDSIELAREIARRAAGAPQPILCAVSAAGEEQKTGVEPERLPELLAGLAELDGRGLSRPHDHAAPAGAAGGQPPVLPRAARAARSPGHAGTAACGAVDGHDRRPGGGGRRGRDPGSGRDRDIRAPPRR